MTFTVAAAGRFGKWCRSEAAKRPALADEIAPVVAFLCADESRWVSGINLPVDGGLASTYV